LHSEIDSKEWQEDAACPGCFQVQQEINLFLLKRNKASKMLKGQLHYLPRGPGIRPPWLLIDVFGSDIRPSKSEASKVMRPFFPAFLAGHCARKNARVEPGCPQRWAGLETSQKL
jgi:hypothetical protein